MPGTGKLRQGLFAFDGDEFHHVFQDAPDLDHVEWFEKIGLPSHGPGYDALLRGKVLYDVDRDRVIIGFYGAPYLSMRRYRRVVEAFEVDESRALEKRLDEAYC
jgi:hypothetical protein